MRDYVFPPIIFPLFLILVVLPFLILFLVFAGSAVFEIIFGIESEKALIIFAMIVIGSLVNIPLFEKKGVEVVRRYEIFGVIYAIRSRKNLTIAVNLGGCVIPAILAFKVLYDIISLIPSIVFLGSFLLSSLIIYAFSRPIPGVGIVVPMFLPPLVATLAAFLALAISNASTILLPKVSFAIGVLSALFGADILHLKDIEKVGYGIVSIGGAGTFDGIFLTGIFAVLFSVLFI